MRLDDEQESSNFEDRTGQGGRSAFPGMGGGLRLGGGKMGCGTLAIILIAALVFGVNPMQLLDGGPVGTTPQIQTGGGGSQGSTIDPNLRSAVLKILGSTERRWADIFARSGSEYRPPKLVFYSESDRSGCGAAQAAMGPFYCPADEGIYLDVSFFGELSQRFGASGDFAAAYVIAHEVGHHIQTITGTSEKVRRAQERVSRVEGNRLQVAMELQADCYAGVWARNDTNLLEAGDIEEGLRAAEAIGDDTLQRASQGVVVPESFTHGSSQQRMAWLKRGLDTGDPAQCNTLGG